MPAPRCARPGCAHVYARHQGTGGACCVVPVGHCPAFLTDAPVEPSPALAVPLGQVTEADEAFGFDAVNATGSASVGLAVSSNTAFAFDPVVGSPSTTAKAIPRGVFTRDGFAPVGGPVQIPTVKVYWNAIEQTQGSRSRAPIESVLATAVSKGFPGVRIRPAVGAYAPTWAKAFGDGPITYTEPQGGSVVTVPDLWNASYQNAVANLFAWMASEFDDDDRFLAVFTSGASTYYQEPLLRGTQSAANRVAFLAAGYTQAADIALQHDSLSWMTAFQRTPVGLSYNPLQLINETTGAGQTSVAEMIDLMDDHRATFGTDRTILQNNSIRSCAGWPSAAYQQMYDELVAQSTTYETQYQVAGSTHICDFDATMEYAIETLNATGVELVNGYQNLATTAEIEDWDTRLIANGP